MNSRSYPPGIRSAFFSEETIAEKAEVVVIGLGAGGSMVFHDLVRAGKKVVALELGGFFPPESMSLAEEEMLSQLFIEGGGRTTVDMSVGIMQGKGIGGSTLHNTSLCKRLPEGIRQRWEEMGVEGLNETLAGDFEAVEELLHVHRIPDDRVNRNNDVLLKGIDALGYQGGRLAYNRRLCQAAGFCELGCPNDGKENGARTLVLPALKEGGSVLIHARAERIVHDGKKAIAVEGVGVDPRTGFGGPSFRIDADQIVFAMSATGSAALGLKSELPDPHNLMGSRLHMHPGAFVMGVFEDAVEGWLGVPQSAECTEFLDFRSHARHRVWLVSGFAHPGAAGGLMPGFGPAHGAMMGLYPHVAAIIAMVHDHASGRVVPGAGERVHVHYRLDQGEYEQIALGLREAARILFAAGAKQVILPTSPPRIASRMAELAKISAADLGPCNPSLVAVHPMSSMWMGEDPATSVVDSYGTYHHLKNLFVADGSLFPTSIGGPPQIPIYTMGRRVARRMLA